MLIFDFITIFPEIVQPYFKDSLLAKAQSKKLLKIRVHNLRDYTTNPHHSVDDKPFGGGLGMVMKVQPWYKAIKKITKAKIKGKNLNLIKELK